MIRDADIFVTVLARGFRHVFDGIDAVARQRVRVQFAANILRRHEAGQGACLRSFDFVMAFAQLRFHVLEAKAAVEYFLRSKALALQLTQRPRCGCQLLQMSF